MLNHEAVEIGEVSLFFYKFYIRQNEKMKEETGKRGHNYDRRD